MTPMKVSPRQGILDRELTMLFHQRYGMHDSNVIVTPSAVHCPM
jgi:hypothetical protein